jgi:parallel beta-helix repeat protein
MQPGAVFLAGGLVLVGCGKKNPAGPGTAAAARETFVSITGDDANTGTAEKPWRSIPHGVSLLNPGDTLTVRRGTYEVTDLIRISRKGNANQWFTIRGESGQAVAIDGMKADFSSGSQYPYNNGILQVENSSYVRIRNLVIRNSHRAGINIQDSDHIDVVNCTVRNSLCPGIAAWQGCTAIRILGNTVINANDPAMSWTPFTGSEAPHEAISMAGPSFFEVAWNRVRDCKKEGIDIKETSAHGKVHHNLVQDCARQGLYIDGWFGVLEDIELSANVVRECEAGIAISSEDGPDTKDLNIHHNLVYNNRATGLFFSRWGADNPRENIRVFNNTFVRNGWGPNFSGDPQYWLSGGCYLYSTNLRDLEIRNNLFDRNKPFEIGYSERYGSDGLSQQNIRIEYNLIFDINTVPIPFHMATWAKDWVTTTKGENAVQGDPLFTNPEAGDFTLRPGSPAVDAGDPGEAYLDPDGTRNDIGAFPLGTTAADFWWVSGFPPEMDFPDP